MLPGRDHAKREAREHTALRITAVSCFALAGYLRTLAVAPGSHGRGTGALLLAAYERGCESPSGGWFLLTSGFNDGAQRFYQRHGYREVGRLPPGFASPGISEVIFWKGAARH